MKDTPKTIQIDNVTYVRADSVGATAKDLDGLEYTIIRSKDSGCWAGYLDKEDEWPGVASVTLYNARRLWYWSGAASLSQLAVDGVSKPNECKFPCEVPEVIVHGVCEEIPATEKARASIASVPVWSA